MEMKYCQQKWFVHLNGKVTSYSNGQVSHGICVAHSNLNETGAYIYFYIKFIGNDIVKRRIICVHQQTHRLSNAFCIFLKFHWAQHRA